MLNSANPNRSLGLALAASLAAALAVIAVTLTHALDRVQLYV
ncbi:MAG: hypothetical protein WBO04_15690 [Steroidobacteraceae bacterium]